MISNTNGATSGAGVLVAQCLVFGVVFLYTIVCLFFLSPLDIVLSIPFRLTASDYFFGIITPFFLHIDCTSRCIPNYNVSYDVGHS